MNNTASSEQPFTTPPSPMMAQWHAAKHQAKDALLFFRLGDFYEAFYKDAEIMAKELSLTLTARQNIPMCGVPSHTADSYIDKLIAKGYKVAVAEQIEDSKDAKGLIQRAITRIITPGTALSPQILLEKRNNFFTAIVSKDEMFGLSSIDLSTGEFRASTLKTIDLILDELHRLRPSEFLATTSFIETHPRFFADLSQSFPFVVNQKQEASLASCLELLALHCDPTPLKNNPPAILAAGTLLLHLKEDLQCSLDQVTSITTESLSQFMAIDRTTQRHLELIESPISEKNTLFAFLDETCTPMGARLLASWLLRPLLSVSEIEIRQSGIAALLAMSDQGGQAREDLHSVRDIERLIARISARTGSPRDLYALARALAPLPCLQKSLASIEDAAILSRLRTLDALDPLVQKILSAMNESPPLRLGDGEIFKDGFDPKLDVLRTLSKESVSWIARYQTTLREETGIKTLKVVYTRAFGYTIEVSHAQGAKVPESFQRRQTLVGGERFVTEVLKQFEHQVLSAEERAKALEATLFETLREEIKQRAPQISNIAKNIAFLDVLLSLAKVAQKGRFIRPTVDTSDRFEIKEGRHPIVEKSIGFASFIPNDVRLSPKEQLMLITGPNMAGKSTYIRQVALLAILAQMGSYVPASFAHIGLIDKVFSRIGASDDLARGQSTFMVEMTETAHILNHATPKSLVLLDEIGRGTSTYDGISIAWAVAHFLLTTPSAQAKTLFATHYWELTQLEKEHANAMNFQTAVHETSKGVVFLRKIIKGGTDKSYGIHVAKLAGLPKKAICKAEAMLKELTEKKSTPIKDLQLSLFQTAENPILTEIRTLDINQISPLAALQKLVEWQHSIQ